MFVFITNFLNFHTMKKKTIKNRFIELGVQDLKPTPEALDKMKISKRRFTTILERKNKTPVTVTELQNIQNWINSSARILSEDLTELID